MSACRHELGFNPTALQPRQFQPWVGLRGWEWVVCLASPEKNLMECRWLLLPYTWWTALPLPLPSARLRFYRAMHFSANRGIAIACRLSVRLSVCLSVTLVNCDHIGWNSSKKISSLVSLGCSLFATPTWRVCSKGNTPKFGPKVTHPPFDLSVGDIRSQIAAEWLQIAQRSQWRAYI